MPNAIVPHWAGSALGDVKSIQLLYRIRTEPGRQASAPARTRLAPVLPGVLGMPSLSTVRSPSPFPLVPTVLSNRREWAQPVVVVTKAGALLRCAWTSEGAGEVGLPAGSITPLLLASCDFSH